jgi:hypothetical protein
MFTCTLYRVLINDCPIAVGVGDEVECPASLITWVRLVSPIGSALGGSVNLSTSLSNVARLAAHPSPTAMGQSFMYNDPVRVYPLLSEYRENGLA